MLDAHQGLPMIKKKQLKDHVGKTHMGLQK
jgi:hypothetical protein